MAKRKQSEGGGVRRARASGRGGRSNAVVLRELRKSLKPITGTLPLCLEGKYVPGKTFASLKEKFVLTTGGGGVRRARASGRPTLDRPARKAVKRREIWYGAFEAGKGLGNVFRTPAMASACRRGPDGFVVEVLVEYWVGLTDLSHAY